MAPWLAGAAHATALSFTEVTTNAGINYAYTRATNTITGAAAEYMDMTGGAVAEDFDGDGWIDLYALQCRKSTNLLYMNKHDGTFADEAAARGVALATDSVAAAAADFDNDGDIDICVSFLKSAPRLLVNQGTGMFTSVELDVNDWPYNFDRYSSPSFGDLNNDGYLDLAIGQWRVDQDLMIFTNDGSGLFLSLTYFDLNAENRRVFSPAFADVNGDRRADLPVTADFTNSQLFLNTGTGFVTRVTTNSGAIATDENGMGCAFGDYDNDGDLDWFVTSIRDTNSPASSGYGRTGNRLYKNDGRGVFSDATDEAGVRDGNWGWGAAFVDLDNDGDLDIYHVNGFTYAFTNSIQFDLRFNNQPARLFENNHDGTFTEVAGPAGAADTGQGRGVVPLDYDNDGDMDLFIVNNQLMTVVGSNTTRAAAPPTLLRNDTPATNRWLNVTLAGTPPFHRNGLGARVYVSTGTNIQMRELNASTGYDGHGPNRIAHIGIGTNPAADQVLAEWFGGDATAMWNVPSNQTVTLPSPRAVLSTNSLKPGQVLTASATNIPPLGTRREWIIDGVTNADPLNMAFYTGTNRELRLDIYDTDNTTLLFSELRRVTIRSTKVDVFAPYFIPSQWLFIWSIESGRIYKLQSAAAPSGTWADITPARTSLINNVYFTNIAYSATAAVYRVLELAP